jgi:hypothetical protein
MLRPSGHALLLSLPPPHSCSKFASRVSSQPRQLVRKHRRGHGAEKGQTCEKPVTVGQHRPRGALRAEPVQVIFSEKSIKVGT